MSKPKVNNQTAIFQQMTGSLDPAAKAKPVPVDDWEDHYEEPDPASEMGNVYPPDDQDDDEPQQQEEEELPKPKPKAAKPPAGTPKPPVKEAKKEEPNSNPATGTPKKSGKAKSPEVSGVDEATIQHIDANLESSLKETRDKVISRIWGESPNRRGFSRFAKGIVSALGVPDNDSETSKRYYSNVQKFIFNGEGITNTLEDFVKNYTAVDASKTASTQQKKKSTKRDVQNAHEVFNVTQSSGMQNAAGLNMVFQQMSAEMARSFIVYIDVVAYVAHAPQKVISKSAREKKTSGNLRGTFRRRVDPGMSANDIIDRCTAADNISYLLTQRIKNASETYRGFLQLLYEHGGEKPAAINWSWGTLIDFFWNNYRDVCESVVRDGINNLAENNVFGAGIYGPFMWRVHTDALLDMHLKLAKGLVGDMRVKQNNSNLVVPTQLGNDIGKWVNVPLCGADCLQYMSLEQARRRINIAVPWCKFASGNPIDIKGQSVEPSMQIKLINKSQSEYQTFLASQRRKQVRKPGPRTAAGRAARSNGAVKVDDWN